MKKFIGSAVLICGFLLFQNISFSDPVPSYGTWLSYHPVNRKFNLKFNNSRSNLGPAWIKPVSDPTSIRFDVYGAVNGNLCHPSAMVEQYKVKTCTMTDMITGAVSQKEFVVLLGTRSPLSSTTNFIQVPTVNGRKTSEFYWDNNRNNVIDSSDKGYYVSCPNYGQPYTLLYLDSVPSIVKVWYYGTNGIGGTISRQFWQGLVRPPVNKFNPVWYNVGYTALSTSVTEAWWADGTWSIGAGPTSILIDGTTWPTGQNVQYGRIIWHAKDIGPTWQVEQWFPYADYWGLDNYIVNPPNPGC